MIQTTKEETEQEGGNYTREFKQITLQHAHGKVLPLDTKLHKKYVVWAMVKSQQPSQQTEEKYGSENQIVAEFSTVSQFHIFIQSYQVGEFWQVQGHLRRPYVMPVGTVLHFFQDGVKPLWEDPACIQGGRFNIRLPKTHTAKYWEDLLLAMIGEQFTLADQVVGLVLSTKYNGDNVAVWHRNCDVKVVEQLRQDICRFVDVENNPVVKMDSGSFQDFLNAPKPSYTPKEFRGGRGGFNRGGRGRGTRGGYSNNNRHTEEENEVFFDRAQKQE